jgi:hypothetical protein
MLTIYGQKIGPSAQVAFDNITVPATSSTATRLDVIVPAQLPALVNISVQANGMSVAAGAYMTTGVKLGQTK